MILISNVDYPTAMQNQVILETLAGGMSLFKLARRPLLDLSIVLTCPLLDLRSLLKHVSVSNVRCANLVHCLTGSLSNLSSVFNMSVNMLTCPWLNLRSVHSLVRFLILVQFRVYNVRC